MDFASAYFFRGYLQEDSGFIAQPWAEIGFQISEPESDGPDITASIGTWGSLHSEQTGATDPTRDIWYEQDFYAGLGMSWDSFEIGLGYTIYTYPSSAFNTVQEVSLGFGYSMPEDSALQQWLGDISATVAFEVNNSNVGSEEAIYLELGFGPSFDLGDSGMTFSVPVTLGMSLDDYYVDGTNDDAFGYLQVGGQLDIPLGSSRFGDTAFNIGVKGLLLGDAGETANNGDDMDVFVHAGFSLSY